MTQLSALSRCTAVDAATFATEHWSRAPLLSRAKELPQPFDDLLSLHTPRARTAGPDRHQSPTHGY